MQTNETTPNSTPPKTQVSPLQSVPEKNTPWLFFIIVIFLFGTTGTFAYKYYELKNQTNQKPTTTQPTQTQQASNLPTSQPTALKKPYTENTDIPNQKKYTNPELGISFLYLAVDPYDNTTKLTTQKMGNKVYVHSEQRHYYTGQYIEIFNKKADQSLEETIKKTFLEYYSEDKCITTTEQTPKNYPSNYIKSNINIKLSGEIANIDEEWRECPIPYTQTNGISYFLMDTNHPNKFAFFSMGQYSIAADTNNLDWQDTVTFID